MAEAPVPAEVVVKPVSSRTSLEAITTTPNAKGKEMATAIQTLSIGTVDAVAGREIPDGTKDNLMIALFGSEKVAKISDPILRPLAANLEAMIVELQTNLDPAAPATPELNAAIQTVIEQTPGWADAFKLMSPTKQAEIIKSIKDMGAASFARRVMMDRITISDESGEYAAARRKFQDLESQLKARRAEQKTVETRLATIGSDRAKATADRDTKSSDVASLRASRDAMLDEKARLEERMAEREENYIDPKTKKFSKAGLKTDPSYSKWEARVAAIDSAITTATTGLNAQIATAEAQLKTMNENVQYFERNDALTAKIEEISTLMATVEGEVITARTAFARKINELTKALNGVLPEGAKEAMNKYKTRLEEANREKTISDAEAKAEKAKKEGDTLTLAEAEITKSIELRYIKTEKQRRMSDFWRQREVHVVDYDALNAEFQQVFNSPAGTGTADLARVIINLGGTPPGAGSGMSAETITYLQKNPDAVTKLVERVRVPLFKSVSKKAVLHLDLSETSLRNIADSPDFIESAKAAITANAEISKVIDQVYGSDLGGSRNLEESLKKMPLGGLVGIFLMMFGALPYKGLFTAGKSP